MKIYKVVCEIAIDDDKLTEEDIRKKVSDSIPEILPESRFSRVNSVVVQTAISGQYKMTLSKEDLEKFKTKKR